MRSFLGAALGLYASISVTFASAGISQRGSELLGYNNETAYTKFTVECPTSTACSEADESLEFEVQISPEDILGSYLSVILNGQEHNLNQGSPNSISPHYLGELNARDSSGASHTVRYSVRADQAENLAAEAQSRGFFFEGSFIDDVRLAHPLLFYASRQIAEPTRLSALSVFTLPGLHVDYRGIDHSFGATKPTLSLASEVMARPVKQVSFDLSNEVDSLHLLEEEAELLKEQIVAKKLAIAQHLKAHRDNASIRHLLDECDSLVCAARILAQRLCDKIGNLATTSEYARVRHSRLQNAVALSEASMMPQEAHMNCTGSQAHGTAQSVNVPLMLTKNTTTSDYHFIDVVRTPNPLVRALALIVTVLGLAALCQYIRRRCMSMRTRVERAADREERRNARAYRKAARRADMRRRWDAFVSAVNCFISPAEPRNEDYEEKRALILQDAFLEQADDLDQMEKGQIMEAEIRELRYAHEIVASLVRVDQHRYDLTTPVHDPPPPLVPLPYTPAARSRASTYTLPSYTSESLPDYSSQPETLLDSTTSDSLVDGFTGYSPSSTGSQGIYTPPSTTSSARTRYTPSSSVLDMSPRPSEETLRTRQSKDTRDR